MTPFSFLANEKTFAIQVIFGVREWGRWPRACFLFSSFVRDNPSSVPVSQESLLLKSNMASLPFVGTLESDDDVDQLDNESDSDEEPEKVYRHYIYT